MKKKVYVEPHNGADKYFMLTVGEFSARVDYDDVDHTSVDVATSLVAEILEKYWDEQEFKKRRKEEAVKVWKENRNGIQDDYLSFKEYMSDNGY